MSEKRNKSADRDKAEKIRELTEENMRLHREIGFLKNELQNQKNSVVHRFKKRSKTESAFLRQARNENAFAQEQFFSYAKRLIKNASVFWVYSSIIDAVRRFTFISTTIRVFIFIFSLIQSSAVFILWTSAIIVSLPFVFLISGIGFMLTFLGGKRATKRARPLVANKKVTVFIPANKKAFSSDRYFAGMVSETAKKPNALAVIVSPGLFFSKGIYGKRRYYFTTRRESENVIVVRKQFYYRFKNKVLLDEAQSITEVY